MEEEIQPVAINEQSTRIDEPDIFTDMSNSIGKLAGALAKAQAVMYNGAKDKSGYGYKYLTLSAALDIVRPALSSNGIAIYQTHRLIKGTVPQVRTESMLIHESGEWIKGVLDLPIQVMKQLSPAQAVGVAASYARRYLLIAQCGIIGSDEDVDGKVAVEIKKEDIFEG